MYTIIKRMEIAGAHRLILDYDSKCQKLHGHNWVVTVRCQSDTLDKNGMVCDFTHLKSKIMDRLDHSFVNDVVQMNPTAENIARWICEQIGDTCKRVDVQESEGNTAIYERD